MRLIVVDDDRLVVDSLKIILGAQPQIEVVGTGANGNDAVSLYAEHAPDIALLDIQMPGRDGLSAAREILERDPAARVVFLTTFSDDEYIVSALKLGARGYLIKTDVAAIPPALAQVMDSKRVLEGKAIEDINFDGAGIEAGTPARGLRRPDRPRVRSRRAHRPRSRQQGDCRHRLYGRGHRTQSHQLDPGKNGPAQPHANRYRLPARVITQRPTAPAQLNGCYRFNAISKLCRFTTMNRRSPTTAYSALTKPTLL